MKKYEYDMAIVEINVNYLTYLNQRGQEGWQIVAVHAMPPTSYTITFMREIPERVEKPEYKHNHSTAFVCTSSCPLVGTRQEIRL